MPGNSPENLFAHVPRAPAEHYYLWFYAAVLSVIENTALSLGSFETAFEQFPFLVGYNNELAAYGLDGMNSITAAQSWQASMRAWEEEVSEHLPLRALREAAALSDDALTLWMCIGLPEEDSRFGALYAALQGTPGQHRPTVGLLNSWWNARRATDAQTHGARSGVLQLMDAGLVQSANPEALRVDRALQVPTELWDVLRGSLSAKPATWAQYHAPANLLSLEEIILSESLRAQTARLPVLLQTGEVQQLLIRGAAHNGRRTLVGAIARELGRGCLEVRDINPGQEARWQLVGALATLLHALPVLMFDPAPGETIALPVLPNCDSAVCLILNSQGGFSGSNSERSLTLTLDIPAAPQRQEHWLAALGEQAPAAAELEGLAKQYRATGGTIRRIAELAVAQAKLAGRSQVSIADVQQAGALHNHQWLESLATKVHISGNWSELATGTQTLTELLHLEQRCRHREELCEAVSVTLRAQLNPGVRALFSGPSGTGKTLAARLLASVLKKDLYRVDLSSVVNKYIGETEKRLSQLFARAEELDVILLLDEGDALMTQRTNVQNANDRYANLETNYLLQRLETYSGILIVTTNAAERIDNAFQRRMDVVVDFRAPEAVERLAIWQLHLPPAHRVADDRLLEIAGRCALTGGQVRNAALHAALLALSNGGTVTTAHLETAVQREYRKIGAVCPLRLARQN